MDENIDALADFMEIFPYPWPPTEEMDNEEVNSNE